MKIFHDYFIGILFIFAGLLLFIRHYFNIQIPVGRFIIGFIFIYLGLSIMFGGYGYRDHGSIIFDEGRINTSDIQGSYNIIFSDGTVDLSTVPFDGGYRRVEVNTIFSKGTLIVNEEVPMIIKATAAFGKVDMPDGASINFGDYRYKTKAYEEGKPCLEVDASTVFGKLRVMD